MRLDPWVRLFLGLFLTLLRQGIKELFQNMISHVIWLIRQFLLIDPSPGTVRYSLNGLDFLKTVFWPAVVWLGAHAALFGPWAPVVTAVVALLTAIRTILQDDSNDGWRPNPARAEHGDHWDD